MLRVVCLALLLLFSLQFSGCGKSDQKISRLQSQVFSLQSRVNEQESTIDDLRQQIEDLEARMDDLESEIYGDQYDDGIFSPIILKRWH
jgi:cell division protein FtsB